MRSSLGLARRFPMVALLTLVAACGASDQGSNGSEQTQSTSLVPATAAEPEPEEGGSSAGGSGDGLIQYSIAGGYDAEGEEPLIPSMSYFDNGIWTMTFGGEAVLVIVNLDPSTPSVNFTDGTASVAGDSSQCTFDIARNDADGAAGSFDCSDVPVVDSGALTQADSFSGSFDVSP